MKQLLPLPLFLFLFLLPCLAWAQYPSNGNQKITLGEQSTADGLIWRGVAATDTVRKPSIDTMAYMVLDTTTNIMWHYKKQTINAWLRLNLLPSDTASMLTNYYRSGRTGIIQASDVPTLNQNTTGSAATLTTSRTFQTNLASTSTASFNGSANVTPGVTGTLPVANGGTGSTTLAGANIITGSGTTNFIPKFSATNTLTSSAMSEGAGFIQSTKRLELENTAYAIVAYADPGNRQVSLGRYNGEPAIQAHLLGGSTVRQLQINPEGGAVGIGITDPATGYRLHVVDSVYVGGRVSAAGYTTRSDYNLKDEIKNINYGLNEIMQIIPVSYTYKSNGEHQLGFIAQDIGVIIPESVHFDEYMGVDYQSIIPILTKAIQEQTIIIKQLEERIKKLEER